MEEFLKNFDNLIYQRYHTVLKNIQVKSNSFYDSYLDLLEETIKHILNENKIAYDETRTCGFVLRTLEIENFFLNDFKLDKEIYEKFKDYTKKVNDHKHKKEKEVRLEGVLNFLRIYYEFINAYLRYKKLDKVITYNEEYYTENFGITLKLNLKYQKEINELKTYLETQSLKEEDSKKLESLIHEKFNKIDDLDLLNNELLKEISLLKDIKLNSLEEKLNKTIDLLNNMQAYLIESRAVSLGVGNAICGKEDLEEFIKEAKKELKF